MCDWPINTFYFTFFTTINKIFEENQTIQETVTLDFKNTISGLCVWKNDIKGLSTVG